MRALPDPALQGHPLPLAGEGEPRWSSSLTTPLIKICGLSTPETLEATIDAGADMAGFVFFEKSPRHVDLVRAAALGRIAAGRIRKVALTVDASDSEIAEIVATLGPDLLQLHGHESPERVAAVKALFGLPVIKAIGVSTQADVDKSATFAAADILLFDAKPALDAAVPGGAGVAFDWDLLRNIPTKNWMLSGGLDAQNVTQALARTRAPALDVSSGVESARGIKDAAKITAFVAAARALSSCAARE